MLSVLLLSHYRDHRGAGDKPMKPQQSVTPLFSASYPLGSLLQYNQASSLICVGLGLLWVPHWEIHFKSPALDLSSLFCPRSAGWNLFESFCDIFLIDVVLVNQHRSSKSCSPTLTSCLCGYISLHYRICWNSWWCCLFKKTVWWRLNVSINVLCSNLFTKAQFHTLKYKCC